MKKSKAHVEKKSEDYSQSTQWYVGAKVAARWTDGVWREATIMKLNMKTSQARVVNDAQGEVVVSLKNLRPPSLPV